MTSPDQGGVLGDITRLRELPEFDNHALVSFAEDALTGLRAVIGVHRANPAVPSFGATRLWQYASDIEGVRDALRLSRLMSYKAALAGLNCGGAKAVIIAPEGDLSEEERTRLIEAYAKRVNVLGGRFITGTDVGIRQSDLELMRAFSPNIVGFNDNSTEFTAIGVYESVREALEAVFGSSDPAGHSFAIQGLGKVGQGFLDLLYGPAGETANIYVSDVDEQLVAQATDRYPRVIPVSPEEITSQEVDVFVPCALSGSITTENADRIPVKIVCGGANNQLENETAGDMLFARGVLYVPDYVANAGGLIAVFDEYSNPAYDRARVDASVRRIPETLRKIFTESRASNIPPNRVANRMAEAIFNRYES